MPSTRCSHCGSTEIDHDPSRGDAVCMQCGAVLEESIIVSEVQYAQDCSGATRAVGQLVSADGNVPSGFNLGHSYGLGKESRMITLQNARRNISNLCMQLKLPDRCVDIAHNFYKMALMRKLTQGRKNPHVVAACVYMVCRKEETPHMLLDLSDILQVNVYELGRTYLKLSTALCINTPAIDPSLYILRFAHQLEFAEKTHEVSVTASRLVQRMKRDWMHTGRRPSGLCGAALLVAARLHNFSRTVDEVIKVVRVCQATVRKRLTEFSETPSSRLTLDEFMTIDLEEEQDPPAFKAARKKKASELDDADEDKVQEATNEISKFQSVIEKALEEAKQKKFAKMSKFTREASVSSVDSTDGTATAEFIMNDTIDSINEVLTSNAKFNTADRNPVLEKLLSPFTTSSVDSGVCSESTQSMSFTLDESSKDMSVTSQNDETENPSNLDFTDLDEKELDAYIMDDEETKSKTEFWFTTNEDYLHEQKEKEEKRLRDEAENANKEQKRKKKRPRTKIQANTTEEAIAKMLQQKKISLKLDYTVLQNLNSENTPAPVETETTEVESEPTEGKPAKRIRLSKPKAPLAPLPPTIRKGISDLVGKAVQRVQASKLLENPEPILELKTSIASPVKVVDDSVHTEEEELVKKINSDDEELEDEDFDDEEEDDEEEAGNFNRHLSAAQLLGHHRGETEADYCDYDYEEYDY